MRKVFYLVHKIHLKCSIFKNYQHFFSSLFTSFGLNIHLDLSNSKENKS